MELLPVLALKRQAAAAGLGAHQASGSQRTGLLLDYAAMLRELARRTGESEFLAKAASAAARAGREAQGETQVAAKLEQAAIARLGAALFADPAVAEAAEEFLGEADAIAVAGPAATTRRLAARAALNAGMALASADVDRALLAATALDTAVDRLDEEERRTGGALVEVAALRCDRADFLIGFGGRLKDKALLAQAEGDLMQLTGRLDPNYLPLSWARAEGLRGAALATQGDLTGEAKVLAEAVRVLAAAAEHVDLDHSPLDRARLGHSLALALASLAEAADDEGLFDHAVASFDQALALLKQTKGLALRALVAHDRAACVAHRAERRGDAHALGQAETAFRAELAVCNAAADPVAWAVTQLALTRVYVAQAELLGGTAPPTEAAVALTEAVDVFTERGLKILAEAAQGQLSRLKEAASRY